MKLLELTLKKRWFDMVASGEKKEEYRDAGKWILSRLEGKQYDAVRFRNGYAKNAPECTVEYKGWEQGTGRREWGGGTKFVAIIKLGRVISTTLNPQQSKERE